MPAEPPVNLQGRMEMFERGVHVAEQVVGVAEVILHLRFDPGVRNGSCQNQGLLILPERRLAFGHLKVGHAEAAESFGLRDLIIALACFLRRLQEDRRCPLGLSLFERE